METGKPESDSHVHVNVVESDPVLSPVFRDAFFLLKLVGTWK